MPVINFENHQPRLADDVFLAPNAYAIGELSIGSESSVFFSVTLRGDILPIEVGSRTNIQEGALLHTSHGRSPCIVGDGVTIGHSSVIHGCNVKDNSLIGMGAIVLDDAIVEEDCIVGANALVTSGTVIPRGSLALGSPAKVVRKLNDSEIESNRESAAHYVEVSRKYLDIFR